MQVSTDEKADGRSQQQQLQSGSSENRFTQLLMMPWIALFKDAQLNFVIFVHYETSQLVTATPAKAQQSYLTILHKENLQNDFRPVTSPCFELPEPHFSHTKNNLAPNLLKL